MNHDDDVRACCQCEAITSLLICAVAAIFWMHLYLDAIQRASDRDRIVMTCIIHHDDQIDNSLRHYFVVGALQSEGGVVSRHYHHNFLGIQHRCKSRVISIVLSEMKNPGLLFAPIDRDVSLRST